MREYVAEAVARFRTSGQEADRREAVRRVWECSDMCWATGDRESSLAWEEFAVESLS